MSTVQKVSFGNNLPGYYVNKGGNSKTAVIVVQEWWGIVDEIIHQAQHISDKTGYQTFIPDLYKGKIGVNAEEASHMMNNLDFKGATAEIKQAAEYLRSNGAQKVGVTGFCMGGALALLAAQAGAVDACVAFYGTPPPELQDADSIKVPVQAHSGSEDSFKGFADPPTVKAFIDKIKGAGTEAIFYEYPGENHGFMNSSQADIREKMATAKLPSGSTEAQEQAWQRSLEFLKKYLE